MSPIRLSIFLTLGSLALFAQDPCANIKQDEANSILGGTATVMPVGRLGCSFSVREKGVRLTVTTLDVGASAAKGTYDGMKDKTKKSGWFVADETGMGSMAYSELIKRSAESSAGKTGFVAVKGTRIIQIYVSDSANKADIAGKKETLDKLRPIAKNIVGRF